MPRKGLTVCLVPVDTAKPRGGDPVDRGEIPGASRSPVGGDRAGVGLGGLSGWRSSRISRTATRSSGSGAAIHLLAS